MRRNGSVGVAQKRVHKNEIIITFTPFTVSSMQTTTKAQGQGSDIWKHFYKGEKYKTNKTHHVAWCQACVNHAAAEIEGDQIREYNAGKRGVVQTQEAIRTEGASKILECEIRMTAHQ